MITNAATQAKHVVSLVFVAAFASEEGEALGDAEDESKDTILSSATGAAPLPDWNPAHRRESKRRYVTQALQTALIGGW